MGRIRVCAWVALVALVAPAAPAAAAATNAAARANAALQQAVAAEQAGRAEAAAAAYEALLESDTTLETAVAPRLVALHADLGHPAQALAWAVRVARRHPDPAAYLAGVHARLGQFKEAELTLREALRGETGADRRATLLWQLAEAQERLGDTDAARDSLAQARDLLPDGPRRATSDRRLDALRHRIRAAERKRSLRTPGGHVPLEKNP